MTDKQLALIINESRLKSRVLVLIGLFFTALVVSSCDSKNNYQDHPQNQWQKVSSAKGGFEVYMPNGEVVIDSTTHVLSEEVVVDIISYRRSTNYDDAGYNVFYQAAYSERNDLQFKDQVLKHFELKKNQIQNDLNGVIIANDPIVNPNYYGQRVVSNALIGERNTQIVSYMIFKDSKLFSFDVFTRSLDKTQEVSNPAIDNFFDSIKFL